MIPHEETLPLVTVAVACYNHARFVTEALESVKSQNYPNLQLIVSDDCSTDNSVEVIRDWLNKNFPNSVFVVHDRNVGICRTANEALALAEGKYLRLLSADDFWLPEVLSKQIDILEAAEEEVGVLYGDAYRISEHGELIPKMFIESHRQLAEMPEGWIYDTLLQGNFIPGMTTVIRRCCFDTVGNFDESLFNEDWDIWLRISRHFKFKYYPEPTANYRIVQTSMIRARADEIVQSEGRMLVKYLRRGWLHGETKERAIDLEYEGACQAYCRELPNRTREAVWTFRHRASFRHALLLVFVLPNISYRRFEGAMKLLRKIKRHAKSFLFGQRAGDEFQ
jgi:Glycosyltransferases, probably involved in cell wall biogenesis